MICPVCKAHYKQEQHVKTCVQCGADLEVHRLLNAVSQRTEHGEINMKENVSVTQVTRSASYALGFEILQIIPAILLLGCVLFGIYIGTRFLNVIDHVGLESSKTKSQWPESGFDQLRQMTTTIKQELDLIVAQRDENLMLQSQVKQLSQQMLSMKKNEQGHMAAIVPSTPTEVTRESKS